MHIQSEMLTVTQQFHFYKNYIVSFLSLEVEEIGLEGIVKKIVLV